MVVKHLAPVCLFVYNRLDETKKTIKALSNNYLASESDLFIFSDAGKTLKDKIKVEEMREYLKSVEGFKSVTLNYSDFNQGLAKSIINGVSQLHQIYEKIIVLEDDLITSPNFLDFMNQGLDFYEKNESIFSISGYSLDISNRNLTDDIYLGYRVSSWGWGSWKRVWQNIDWEVRDYHLFIKDKNRIKNFKRGGSDLPRMLANQMEGKIDSWAIRYCYQQFKNNMYTVFPATSKIISIGFSEHATNTSHGAKRFDTQLDPGTRRNFKFKTNLEIDETIQKIIRSKFNLFSRIQNQIMKRLIINIRKFRYERE